MSRLRRVNHLCSRTVSGTANRLKKHGRKNPLPFPFSQRSHVGNLRQTIQGKGVIHKRVETAGVYPLVRPRGVSAVAAAQPPQFSQPKIGCHSRSAGYHCKNLSQNWLSTLSTGLSTGYLGITLCIKWITFCIHPRRPPYISVFRLRIVISAVEKPPLHNPPHLVENL